MIRSFRRTAVSADPAAPSQTTVIEHPEPAAPEPQDLDLETRRAEIAAELALTEDEEAAALYAALKAKEKQRATLAAQLAAVDNELSAHAAERAAIAAAEQEAERRHNGIQRIAKISQAQKKRAAIIAEETAKIAPACVVIESAIKTIIATTVEHEAATNTLSQIFGSLPGDKFAINPEFQEAGGVALSAARTKIEPGFNSKSFPSEAMVIIMALLTDTAFQAEVKRAAGYVSDKDWFPKPPAKEQTPFLFTAPVYSR